MMLNTYKNLFSKAELSEVMQILLKTTLWKYSYVQLPSKINGLSFFFSFLWE